MPERLAKPRKTASFKEYMEYYLERKNWSQNKLAIAARLNQSQVNKIINGTVYTVQVDTLVCLCLVLQLNLDESKDLLARAERAFSPASVLHQTYQELIKIYAKRPLDCSDNVGFFDEADHILTANGLPVLPNCYR